MARQEQMVELIDAVLDEFADIAPPDSLAAKPRSEFPSPPPSSHPPFSSVDSEPACERMDGVYGLWIAMVGAFGSSWIREYGDHDGKTANYWRRVLREAGITDKEIERVCMLLTLQRPLEQPDKAAYLPKLPEVIALALESRIPDDFPSVDEVIEEGLRVFGSRSGGWSCEWRQRIAQDAGSWVFRTGTREQIARAVTRARDRLRKKLVKGEPLPPLHRLEGGENERSEPRPASPERVREHLKKMRSLLRAQ